MPRLPLVAIIGRPNTGKSTLFNRMIGERKAIESEIAGTTRDHIAHKVETDEVDYLLVDTGGMGGGTDDHDFESDVEGQSLLAMENADVILLTFNAREELTGADQNIVKILRKRKRGHVPVLLVPTKCDNEKIADEAKNEALSLGLGEEIFPVSGFHGLGVSELEETIEHHLKKLHFAKGEQPRDSARGERATKVAIIGKPNVGKSSLVNALMSEEQRGTSPRLVSDIPGTTRDSADTIIKHEGKEYVFVDTAGLKRNARTDRGIDQYAMLRSIQAIEEADVVVLLIEAKELVSKQDKRIANIAVESGKGMVILINKGDLLTGEEKKEKLMEVRQALLFCRYAPILFGSAKTREGILKIFPHIDAIAESRYRRIAVKDLREWYINAVSSQPMSSLHSSKYITQAEDVPPTFVLFVKSTKRVTSSQMRYLENRFRETFGFDGTPIRFILKSNPRKTDE